ncbi:hypothetical protein QUA43_02785 [Microcoleus sp. N9_B4]|uniref:hypothetical protein n=1 Tax=Microcoleus sp. N9_B4 TaxID=3055386 RepID=UPI002FD14ABC
MAAGIEFKLFASNNKAAKLLGSFSKWAEIPLEKDDKGYFRTKIQLEDGILSIQIPSSVAKSMF